MKQQKRHRAFEKPVLKPLSWSVALSILVYIAWASNINCKTIFEFNQWWLIIGSVIGFAVGIIRLIKDKEILWNWKEYFGGLYYSAVHACFGCLIGLFLFGSVEIMNYYIPTSHSFCNETATITGKYIGGNRSIVHYVTFHFENEQLGKQNLQSDSDFYNQATPGDKYIFTLQNGFFNIPVIKDKNKQ
ncbi:MULTISPECIES: hypothetical protein [Butyricimonas]|uniref:hypothetical protein n=1 Tax=Butyricimonas TaxID=574697 RepID=UPI0007FB3358|nr:MULTISPECIES: hypothetical protein [Butyricimonas]